MSPLRKKAMTLAASLVVVTSTATGAAAGTAPAASEREGNVKVAFVGNGVTVYSGVRTQEQAAGVCDNGGFCSWSWQAGELAAADDCGVTFPIPSSWRTGDGGGKWFQNLPRGWRVRMALRAGGAFTTQPAVYGDDTADWRPVSRWTIIC